MPHKLPTDCVLAVTYRCNSHCLMCDIWKIKDFAELPAEEYAKLPSSLRDINISGGEPFLRPDLAEVVRVVAAACPKARLVISTNGLATDLITEKLKEILLIKPDIGVAVSVDGIGERHDEIRGVPSGFDRAMETVRALQGLGIKNLRLAFTLMERNVGQLSKVYDLSRELGVEFTHTHAQSSEIYFGGKKNLDFRAEGEAGRLSLLKKEYDHIIKNELKTWSVKRWLRAYYAYGMYRFITGREQVLSGAPGRDFFFMNQKGDIYPSVAHNAVMGNINVIARPTKQPLRYSGDCFVSRLSRDPRNDMDFKFFWRSEAASAARKAAAAQNVPLWMICTARTAMRRHPLRVGWWLARNYLILSVLIGLALPLVWFAPASAAPSLANYYLNVLPTDSASVAGLAKYDVLIITPGQAAMHQNIVDDIRRRNPGIVILAYFPIQSYNQRYWPGDPIFRDLRVKDEWWLKDSRGRVVSHWSDLLNTNMRADYAEYLARFANERVLAIPGIDGLFLDMVSESISWAGHDLDLDADGLPDASEAADREWRQRMEYFLRFAADNIKAKFIIINGSSYGRFQPLVNGRMFENFPTPWEGNGRWATNMNNLVKDQRDNRLPRLTIINSNSGNTGNQGDYRKVRFGLSSALLEDDVYYSFDYGDQNHGQLWRYDEYEVDLGEAIGEARSPAGQSKYSDGVWQRDYQRGLAIVNAGGRAQEVNLGGEYEKIIGRQDPAVNDGAITDRVRLPAHDGLIMLKTFQTIKEIVFGNGFFLRFFDLFGGRVRNGFFSYEEGLPGGAQIYRGDLDGDGREEKILLDGQQMEIFNSEGARWFKDYLERNDFRGEVRLAVGKMFKGGQDQLLAASSAGGRIILFNYHGALMQTGFFPMGRNYRGGLAAAIGNVDGGEEGEAIIGAGGSRWPAEVLIYNNRLEEKKGGFYPFGKRFFGEIKIAVGDVNADGRDEIIVGAVRDGEGALAVFDSAGRKIGGFSLGAALGGQLAGLAVKDVNFDGIEDIVVMSR